MLTPKNLIDCFTYCQLKSTEGHITWESLVQLFLNHEKMHEGNKKIVPPLRKITKDSLKVKELSGKSKITHEQKKYLTYIFASDLHLEKCNGSDKR